MLYIFCKTIHTIFVLYLLLLWILYPTPLNAQTSSTPYQEFRRLLREIKVAVQEENIALALDLLDRATKMFDDLEERPILDEEAVLWDKAQLNLERSETMENPQQIALFANESVKAWLEYIDWHKNLDDRQKKIIEENPNSDRFQIAVKQLGNALVRRGNINPYSIRDLFEIYLDIPVEYLSSQSVRLWRIWLFRCPSWEETTNFSLRDLKAKFESGRDYCREDWVDFTGFLEIWLETQSLTESKKRNFKRWLKDLHYALNYNNTL